MTTTEDRNGSGGGGPDGGIIYMPLEVLVIPVSDVDRAKAFYAALGWRLDADRAGHEFRLVQFTPPGSGCSVQFGTNLTMAPPGSAQGMMLTVSDIQAAREASQPLRTRTGGSTFANPPGQQAWRLIDAVGGRGLRRGGAMVSEKHTNFLINTGTASAADIEGLGEELRRRVHA